MKKERRTQRKEAEGSEKNVRKNPVIYGRNSTNKRNCKKNGLLIYIAPFVSTYLLASVGFSQQLSLSCFATSLALHCPLNNDDCGSELAVFMSSQGRSCYHNSGGNCMRHISEGEVRVTTNV